MSPKPLAIFMVMLAGWVNRQQQDVIDYLKEENKVLREKLGKRGILLNNDQRRRLAIRGRKLGRRLLADSCCIFSPDTYRYEESRPVSASKGLYKLCFFA